MLEVNRSILETIEGRNEGKVDAASEIIGRVRIESGPKSEAPGSLALRSLAPIP